MTAPWDSCRCILVQLHEQLSMPLSGPYSTFICHSKLVNLNGDASPLLSAQECQIPARGLLAGALTDEGVALHLKYRTCPAPSRRACGIKGLYSLASALGSTIVCQTALPGHSTKQNPTSLRAALLLAPAGSMAPLSGPEAAGAFEEGTPFAYERPPRDRRWVALFALAWLLCVCGGIVGAVNR